MHEVKKYKYIKASFSIYVDSKSNTSENIKWEDLHLSVFMRDFQLSTYSLDKACAWIDLITC